MIEIKTILVPVDLDQHTEKVADYALFIAKGLGAELLFLHAVEFMTMSEMGLGNLAYEDYTAAQIKQAEETLTELVAKGTEQGCGCDSKVVIGDTVDEIIDLAATGNHSLIIMGTHGKRGLEKILLGSVAERVLKSAHCPVLVVNPYKHGQ